MTHEDAATDRLSLRDERVHWRRVEGEVIALDLGDQRYLAVNGSGAVLWELLTAGTTRAALVGALRDTYGLDEAQAAADVDAFLATLDTRGLLERAA
jgi:hypothetical protein